MPSVAKPRKQKTAVSSVDSPGRILHVQDIRLWSTNPPRRRTLATTMAMCRQRPMKKNRMKMDIIAISVEMVGKPPKGYVNGGYGPPFGAEKTRPPPKIMAMVDYRG
jgi:hypothetical protein